MNEREIFLSALEIEDPAARRTFMHSECAGDQELLVRVESLLTLNDTPSQFLNTPVVEQIADVAEAEAAATMLTGDASTQDDEPEMTAVNSPGSTPMTTPQDDSDDEIPLGYLEPSSNPGSLGRLGHYEVLEVIGRGAFGTVLRAFDEKLHRVVAIKVMAPELASTSPARRRFIREAQASAAIRHEHVVSVYAVEEKPLPYLVMEFIPGLTLQQRLDERGPLDVPTVLRIGKQIAEGLAAAHAQDLIHRDIKPANILLETGAREMVKVTDFGLARAADDASLTQSGTIAGTPMYMAPEQAMGQKLDQRADLFSFGSVLYQMVSGRPPFRAATTLAVLKRLAEDTPRPIREIIPEAPQWLCDIIAKLHAKNPDQRYQTAREIADVLADCEAQLKAHAGLKDLSRIPRTKSPSAGWWKWIAAAVVVLPLVAFGLSALNRPAAQPNVARNEIAEPATNPDPMKPVSETTPDEVTHPIAPESAGWVQLFNGKDLSGWKTHDLAPGNWRVEDGAIVGRGDKSFLSFLFSESEYADFHLRVEAKINAIGDSGVNFRAPFDVRLWKGGPNIWVAGGYEAQIGVRSNDRNHTGSLFCAAEPPLMPLIQQGPLMPHRPDEWFVLEVIAQGNRIQTFVNGKKTADYVDEQRRSDRGHLALHTWGRNITFVQFRKIDIKELPSSAPTPQPQFYSSNEWIDVIPLIVPQLDKWDMRLTGKNEWRIEQGELVVGSADKKPSKLLFPLDADFFPSFECELELTRRTGEHGFNLNFPTAIGDTPLTFDFPAKRGVFVRHLRNGIMPISESPQIETEKRTTVRVEVRHQQAGDQISIWNNDAVVGTWKGNRNELASGNNEGYDHRRRLSLWIHGGHNEFVFHRIRIRMLDGGTAESLRPVPRTSPVTVAKQELPPTFKNDIGMEFVIVPKGKSWLGGGQDKPGDQEVEIPADFYLGKYEVTQEEWQKLTGANPSGFKAVAGIKPEEQKRFPVERVSWDDCQEFVKLLNAKVKEPGWVYRLATDREWEYACRGGPLPDRSRSTFKFYFDEPTNTLTANQASFEETGLKRTCAVGSYKPNALGLYDMHGNVWEWCADEVDDNNGASLRVLRGGGWSYSSEYCQAAGRGSFAPSHGDSYLGLRLARVPAGARLSKAKTASAVAPITDADVQRIAALPAAEQVEEVRKELMRRNPGFDGTVEHKIENDVVTELRIVTDQVTDIAPIRVWSALRTLKCRGTHTNGKANGLLADLTPLEGMNLAGLTHLDLRNTHVSDAGMVSFKDCKNLTVLVLDSTQVEDAGLAHFQGMPLKDLTINNTGITDLTPLQGMPLEDIRLTPKNITRGLDILRAMKSLKTIGIDANQSWPAAEFWERYDKGGFKE